MGKKDSDKKGKFKAKKIVKGVIGCMVAVVLAVLLAILIIWLVLRPTKPRYFLQDAAVLHFNLSDSAQPYQLSSVLQATVATRNPNSRIGIRYGNLKVYAVYKSQQITLASNIQPYYQGHKDVAIWSPVLYGMSVPISPYVCSQLVQDGSAGLVLLNIKIDGLLKWKVGSWTSSKYHIHVNCPAYLVFTSDRRDKYKRRHHKSNDDMVFGNGFYNPTIRLQQQNFRCSVDV